MLPIAYTHARIAQIRARNSANACAQYRKCSFACQEPVWRHQWRAYPTQWRAYLAASMAGIFGYLVGSFGGINCGHIRLFSGLIWRHQWRFSVAQRQTQRRAHFACPIGSLDSKCKLKIYCYSNTKKANLYHTALWCKSAALMNTG